MNKAEMNNPFLLTAKISLDSSRNVRDYPLSVELFPSFFGNASTAALVPTASGSVKVYDLSSPLSPIWSSTKPSSPVALSECRLDKSDPNYIWACDATTNTVKLWDMRTGSDPVHSIYQYKQTPMSMDVNSSHTLLAVGTELSGEDANIHFWDLRNLSQTPLATFSDCHSDDITQIQFHPTVDNAMMSGSTDGLVCLYQLKEFLEDDDLYQVIKDQSVHRIGCFGPASEYVYILSHIETLSLYQFEEGAKIHNFGDIRTFGKDPSTLYLEETPSMDPLQQSLSQIDSLLDCCYDASSERLSLVTCSSEGNMSIYDIQIGSIDLIFTLNGGHPDSTVRHVSWSPERNLLLSAGEDGNVCIWRR